MADRRTRRWLALVAFLAAGAAGCGGGGGGSSSPATPTQAVPSPTPSALATFTANPTATAVSEPTATPVATVDPPPPPSATAQPTPTATSPTEPTPDATYTPTVHATQAPTQAPTATPTEVPTQAPTPTPLPMGPVVSALGLADTNGTFDQSIGQDPLGRPIFARQSGSGFILFVEGRPGRSGLPVARNLFSLVPGSAAGLPDLQILVSRDLGNGSAAVCDREFPNAGGVPGTGPPLFAFDERTSAALNDLSCRFRVFSESGFACTQDAGNSFRFANLASTVQFCTLVSEALTFPPGDTVLTVRLRDTAGQVGEPVQIVVRIRA